MNKKKTFKLLLLAAVLLSLTACQNTSNPKVDGPKTSGKPAIFEETFSKEDKELSDDFFVMDGHFIPKKLGNNYALFMLPTPLKTNGCLMGPDLKGDVIVSADVFAGKRGRTFPVFGVGTHGLTGFRLYLKPSPRGAALQIIYNETQVIGSAEYKGWTTDNWTSMKLLVRKVGENVEVFGKAWQQNEKEAAWQVSYKGKLKIEEGQSSIWGIPYSGRDMFFDNLRIEKP